MWPQGPAKGGWSQGGPCWENGAGSPVRWAGRRHHLPAAQPTVRFCEAVMAPSFSARAVSTLGRSWGQRVAAL